MKISTYLLSLSEYIFETIVVFIVFRIVITTLGLNYVGVWSLAMSLMALTSVGSSGFASSAVKFVSENYSNGDYQKTRQVITTTFFTVLAISMLMSGLTYCAFLYKGEKYLKPFEHRLLNEIILIIFSSFILGSAGRVFISSLDGMLEINKRSLTGIISKIFYFVFSIGLLKQFGLWGLAVGLVIKEGISFSIAFYFVTRKLNYNILSPAYISGSVFREIFHYGYKFQLNSVIGMLTDPVTKFLIKDFGGLHLLGLFEIIYKFFWQARMLIVVVMNTYLPTLAGKSQKGGLQFTRFFNFTFSFSLLALALVFPLIPIIMHFLKLENTPIVYVISLALLSSLFVNLLGTTAYIHNLANGQLNSILYGTLIFAFISIGAGYVAGKLFYFNGFLVMWILAHFASTLYLVVFYLKKEEIPFSEIFDWAYLRISLLIVTVVAIIALFSYYSYGTVNSVLLAGINLSFLASTSILLFKLEVRFKYPIAFVLQKFNWPFFARKKKMIN
ncbi:hypothetical protein [Dyadobacter psychrotolerans]|uniref:Polysaccharide biosynthesis protein n=1 Tax=Dyadobacter psychrotolerans TaxID=2541721 RepID=A0A4V2Z4X6_9BACT|nr:hypothetical protein [Dyadobacter psychrotolerans]TDE18438.1 hypothetical protein E0F88_02560 [Dyadobacter psychrotolerans]